MEKGFTFLPNRFLHGGFFASLCDLERSLYLFLLLASDRNGVSYYSLDRISATLETPIDDVVAARNALIAKDLIAFDGFCFQVLSLPPQPVALHSRALRTPEDFERDDPATIRQIIRDSLGITKKCNEP